VTSRQRLSTGLSLIQGIEENLIDMDSNRLVNDGHLACKWDALYGLEYATIRDMPEELLDLVKKIDPRLVSPQVWILTRAEI
jgi:hypothetical protein